MFTALRNTVSLAVAAMATIVIVAGSAAPVSAETVTATIHTGGTDLATPAGFQRVQAEIQRAARRICNTGETRSLAAQKQGRTCMKTAMNTAMPRLEMLAAVARDSRTQLADAAQPTVIVRR